MALFRRCRYTKKDTPKSPSMLTPPSVSILRPLKGLDINLRENLLSSFVQNYPAYEIIFSVAKEDDPAIPVVKELMEEHPEIETRLIIGKALVEGRAIGLGTRALY